MSTILEITAPSLDWVLLAPMIVLFTGATLGLLVEAFAPQQLRFSLQSVLAGLVVLTALGAQVNNWTDFTPSLQAEGAIALDGPAYLFSIIILTFGLGGVALFAERELGAGLSAFASSVATVPGSPLERQAEQQRRENTEVFPLLLFSLLGMLMFVSANNLLVMFVALEIFSLPLYLLTGMARRRRLLSQEGALKYFLLGAMASAMFLFGSALAYGYSGGLSLGGIADALQAGDQSYVVLLASMLLLSVGLLFKLGAVPFHSWAPDAYTGAPTPVTAFMAAATKTAAVAGLLRVFFVALGGARWDWQPVFAVLAVITMLVGAAVALRQTDVKRLLAYSSIAHAGFLLVGVVGTSIVGISTIGAIGFYMLAYGLATFGAFTIVMMVRRAGGEATDIESWNGLGRRHPWLAAAMTLFLLSFAGIPLTAGFVGKLVVFATAWVGGFGWLVLIAVFMSVVAAFLYLKLVVAMWFAEPDPDQAGEVAVSSLWAWSVLVVCVIGTVVLGILPGAVLGLGAQTGLFIR
ncbi:MAG: NADH-quinone oxidoreductase subunit NuoN [Arachnia propionica]|nr:MAG: NADH-quinone oxidoreductase subunit NuoN [Arachnia propionica]